MSNDKILHYGKRVFFTIFTQGLLSIVSIVVGFGLPKFLPIEEYSRWQLYYFYVAYVNFLQLGFNDGLILNLSGTSFDRLPWKRIKNSTFAIVLYLLGISILFLCFGKVFITSDFQVFRLLTYSLIPTVLMCIFSAVLLAGNKTYEYNLFSLLIRVAFVMIMLAGVIFDITNADFYIIADIFSKVVIIIIFYFIERKNMKGADRAERVPEFIKTNCSSGIIVASTILILGLLPMCGRVVIQVCGSTKDYARYSFAISMLSIILTFTNAIGTVAFPMLKNIGGGNSPSHYRKLCRLYDEVLWICFFSLVVIEFVITKFLTEYIPVLDYFVILLAICWPFGKIQSIVYPYYKLFRKEKEFLIISVISISATFLLSFGLFRASQMRGLAWAALLGVLLCNFILDVYYSRKIAQGDSEFHPASLVMFVCFLVSGLLFHGGAFAVVYGILLLVHFLFLGWKLQKIKHS